MSIVGFRSTLPVPIGDMAGNERPAKRMKLGGQDAAETGAFIRGNLPSSASFNVLSNAAAASQTWEVPGMVDDGWKYAGAGPAAPPSGFFMPMMPVSGVYPMFQDSQVGLISGKGFGLSVWHVYMHLLCLCLASLVPPAGCALHVR